MRNVFRLARHRAPTFAVATMLAAALGFIALVVSMSDRGDAAFPGSNGKIAYSYGDGYSGAIWSANADGSLPTMLTSGSNDYEPSYSANGARIAFGRTNGVYVMNSDGSGLTQLVAGSSSSSVKTEWQENYETPGPSSKIIPFVRIQAFTGSWHSFGAPSFSPDGSQLAVSETFGESVQKSICAVEEDEDEECLEYSSPDAYFDFDYECIKCTSQIITISSANGARTGEVTPLSTTNEDWGPTYSPSGAIAFSRFSPGGSAINVVSSPGAAATQVTSGPSDYSPDFSPDGSRIVFNRGGDELGIVGAAGGPVSLLTVPGTGPSGFLGAPAFSPDGQRITFERSIRPPGGKRETGVYTMGVDGSSVTKLVNGFEPNWQPVPIPPPPVKAAKAKAKKGKVKLDKKHRAVIGTIVCGSSPCKLKVLKSRLKTGKKACGVKTTVPKQLAAGKSAKVKVKVTGKCLAALNKAGKGKLVTKISVADAAGKKVLALKTTLVPGKAPKKAEKGK